LILNVHLSRKPAEPVAPSGAGAAKSAMPKEPEVA
jgi:hypothetical protein